MSKVYRNPEVYWPTEICFDCGVTHGSRPPDRPIGCWMGRCDWCEQEKSCASPRDYGYPLPPVRMTDERR